MKIYKKDKKGKVRFWEAKAVDGVFHSWSGVVGAEDTSTIHNQFDAIPTNVGKKSFRDATAQAAFEVEAKYIYQMQRNGYKMTIAETNDESDKVQLAHDVIKKNNWSKVDWGATDGQFKLNGVRCRILIHADGSYTAFSRKDTVYTLPPTLHKHVTFLIKCLPPSIKQIDGEIYKHGLCLEEISSLIKDVEDTGRDVLEFHWYDVMGTGLSWKLRYEMMLRIWQGEDESVYIGDRIRFVYAEPLANREEADAFHLKALQAGYEGMMFRNHKGMYICGERSYDLLKFKVFMEDEFRINGVKLDKRGHGVFVCSIPNNVRTFSVRWKTTNAKRKHVAEHPEEYIEKLLTVKFQNYSMFGVPIFPVGIVIRDYE
ncbi:DNA ligase [Yersinia phage vB_YenM_P778]